MNNIYLVIEDSKYPVHAFELESDAGEYAEMLNKEYNAKRTRLGHLEASRQVFTVKEIEFTAA